MRQDIKECLSSNYMPYAVSVIMERALPQIDGFKPSHRKLLYTMFQMHLIKGNKTKSANIVGQTMKLNPHGDQAIYETMVRLTQRNEALLLPYVDAKGNFGKVYSRDMAYGASRYTEAKLGGIATELFSGIEKGNVPMVDNYDNTMKEPELLPVTFPNILANVNTGIAVGMASNICSFNLIELCDYTIQRLQNLTTTPLIPDFSTGGEIILNQEVFDKIDKYGSGSVKVRAKYTFNSEDNCIEIYEIPYTTSIEAIIDKLEELIKAGKIKDIHDVRDETDLKGLKITIDLKRGVDADVLMNKLFKATSLEDSFSCNFNVIVDNKPQVLGVGSIIDKWVTFRKQCLNRELHYDINKLEEERNRLKGLETIVSNLDDAIAIIRSARSEKEAMDKLQERFKLNQAQLDYICGIKLVNMNKDWLGKKIEKLSSVDIDLAIARNNLSDDNYYIDTIISQLQDIKATHGIPRKTTLIEVVETPADTTGSKKDTIENFNCTLVVTQEGYIKRNVKYAETQKVKDGDIVTQVIPSTNHSKIMFFTDKANVYFCNGWDLPTHTPSTLGTYIPSTLGLDNEKIVHVVSTSDFKGWLLFAYANGKVAKVTLNSYQTKTNRSKMVNGYNLDSELVSITHITQNQDFQAVSSIDKILVVDTAKIGEKSAKTSQGVNVLKSKNDSVMVEFKPVDIENPEYYKANPNATGKYRK